MLYAISYDITDDKRRRQAQETLKNFGRRVQFSVFECKLEDLDFVDLWTQLETIIDPTNDSLRAYPLCAACQPKVEILGKGDRYEDHGYLIIS
jgi:CRISPR-associated protein Cas2